MMCDAKKYLIVRSCSIMVGHIEGIICFLRILCQERPELFRRDLFLSRAGLKEVQKALEGNLRYIILYLYCIFSGFLFMFIHVDTAQLTEHFTFSEPRNPQIVRSAETPIDSF